MERPAVHSAPGRPTHYHWRRRIPEIMSLGDEIRNLVERAHDEINELHLANGPQAAIAHAAGGANDGAFADRRVNHAFPAKTLEQAFAGLERSAVHANVFAHQNYRGVTLHLLEHGLLDGFEKR